LHQAFLQYRELAGGTLISWNFTEFSVAYPSLAEEIKIGDYFLRLLLEEDQVYKKTREPSLKGNAQYSWPPCTNEFSSARFHIQTSFTFFTKQVP
jgi:DNAJ protein RME-8 N-terminal